jgi:hypothetical protein
VTLVLFVTLLLAAVLLARGLWFGYPPPSWRPRALSAKELAVVAACAEALLPAGGAFTPSAVEVGVVEYFDNLLAEIPARQRSLLRLLLVLLEHASWLRGRRRLTRQSLAERARTLEAWRHSRVYLLRSGFLSVRMLLTMGYLAHPAIQAVLGYTPNRRPFESYA